MGGFKSSPHLNEGQGAVARSGHGTLLLELLWSRTILASVWGQPVHLPPPATGNQPETMAFETLLFQKNPKGVWIQNWETVVKVWLLHINQLQRELEGHNLNPYGPYKYPALAMYGWPCHPHLVMKSHGSVDEWHRLATVQSSAHSKCCGAICEIGPDSKNARICSNPISAFACNLTVQKNRGSKDETGNQENLKPPRPEILKIAVGIVISPWYPGSYQNLQYLVVKVPPNKN